MVMCRLKDKCREFDPKLCDGVIACLTAFRLFGKMKSPRVKTQKLRLWTKEGIKEYTGKIAYWRDGTIAFIPDDVDLSP